MDLVEQYGPLSFSLEFYLQAQGLSRPARAPAARLGLADVPAPGGASMAAGQTREGQKARGLIIVGNDPAAAVRVSHEGVEPEGVPFAGIDRQVGHPAIDFGLSPPAVEPLAVVRTKGPQTNHA